MHPLLEPKFEPCSFAYRPGRSHLMAVRQVGLWRDRGYTWVLDADVRPILEMAQFQRQQEETFKLTMARSLVRGKLWNSKQLLLWLNRKRQLAEVAAAIAGLSQDLTAVSQHANTPMLDHVRGYEGAGAARYFAALGLLIANPGFTWTERAFHPPPIP